ncbi:MAG TPA: hypothetical protein DCQ06_13285 [Myxococcales bacterium]|nr:hypothetical protein [Myxococcales bacterium]
MLLDSNKHYGGALYIASGLAMGISSYLLFVRKPRSNTPAADRAQALDVDDQRRPFSSTWQW